MATETEQAVEKGAEAAGGPGMPQLDFSTFDNQIFWLLVTLILLYFVLARVALPRIAAILSERQGTITNDLTAAEDLKAKAAEAEEAYNKALADARAEAQKIVAQAKDEIKAELDEEVAKADAEIAEQVAESEKKIAEIRESAMESAKEVAKDTAKELVAAMGAEADGRTVTAAVNQRLKG
jgi:F-type H+-transporting ATPase subunit b